MLKFRFFEKFGIFENIFEYSEEEIRYIFIPVSFLGHKWSDCGSAGKHRQRDAIGGGVV